MPSDSPREFSSDLSRGPCWLFVPGSNARRVDKALSLLEDPLAAVDVVIVDWEDAVAVDQRQAAREVTVERLARLSVPLRQRVAVRINEPMACSEDLAALEGWLLGAVLVPKVEHADQLRAAAELELPLVPLLESALGLERAFAIASAHWVRGLALGPLDLMADLGVDWRADHPLLHEARLRTVLAGRAAGLRDLLAGPFADLNDDEGLARDGEALCDLGFTGRLLIHPKQAVPTVQAFAPTLEQLEWARRVVRAATAAKEEGRVALQVDGQFVDAPVLRRARQLLRVRVGGWYPDSSQERSEETP